LRNGLFGMPSFPCMFAIQARLTNGYPAFV
jgi:hypothetical protein